MKTIAILLAALGALASGAASAAAEPALRDVAPASADLVTGSSQVVADRGLVAYLSQPGRVRVIDASLAEVASIAEPGCIWRAFGGGALLWSCEPPAAQDQSGYSLIDGLDGSARTVLEPPTSLGFGGHGEIPTWSGIGLRWLIATFDGESFVYVNRDTGKVDRRTDRASRAARRLITDVDQADLTRRVCAPLAQQYVEGLHGSSVAVPLAYRPPYGATRSGSRLLTGRCGARRLTVLSHCRRACSDPVVGYGFVAWTEGVTPGRRELYVRLIDRRRTWRWQIQPPPSQHVIAALGQRLFVLDGAALRTVRLPAPVATRRRSVP